MTLFTLAGNQVWLHCELPVLPYFIEATIFTCAAPRFRYPFNVRPADSPGLPLRLATYSDEAWDMIDTKRTGTRCRARKLIRDHGITIKPDNQGTIVYEIDDLERQLILV